MKSLEVIPSNNVLKGELKNNVLGINSSILDFISLLSTIKEYYSIALNGKWGSGKTFYTRKTKLLLDSFNSIRFI
ncbi:P-loop NTPase fold protein [Lactobacillus sp. PSON]|uniref:P-loop NTPase fold protein n=1 Tax=Lactobacillus sp. PSON TaxID=3455454 RepID=UPI0040410406